MCWVAVDRGIRLAERYGLPCDAERWRSARIAIHRRVVMQGWSEKHKAFAQSLGSDVLDAAVPRMSQGRFLDDRGPRIATTGDARAHRPRARPLVRRYRTEEGDDAIAAGAGSS